MLDMPGDWVVQDRSRNFSWYTQKRSLAWQCYAGTALQKGGLCCGHNSNLGGRELSSTLRDLCWELKQVQYRTSVACSVTWGDGCHCSSLCLWFLPPNPSGTVSAKGPRSRCLLLQFQAQELLLRLLSASHLPISYF